MSSNNLAPIKLPSIDDLRRLTQSIAMLDAIISPDWADRYYSFNTHWSADEAMASMRDGSGNDWFLLFSPAGAVLKGFAHKLASKSKVAQTIQELVPKSFSSFLHEPAFSMQYATFCYWCLTNNKTWQSVPSSDTDDGSNDLLKLLVSGPHAYKEWAEQYYKAPVQIDIVIAIYEHMPLTEAAVLALNPGSELSFIFSQADEIGFPTSRT